MQWGTFNSMNRREAKLTEPARADRIIAKNAQNSVRQRALSVPGILQEALQF